MEPMFTMKGPVDVKLKAGPTRPTLLILVSPVSPPHRGRDGGDLSLAPANPTFM